MRTAKTYKRKDTASSHVEKLPIPYQGSGLISRRPFIASSPATAENVLKGLIDSVAFIRNPANKSDVIKILAKGMRLPRIQDAEEGYQSMVGLYEKKLYPSVQGIRNVIRLLGTTNEKIRRLKAEDLVDDSIVKKLEKDGRLRLKHPQIDRVPPSNQGFG